jgi:hypothetical protein
MFLYLQDLSFRLRQIYFVRWEAKIHNVDVNECIISVILR